MKKTCNLAIAGIGQRGCGFVKMAQNHQDVKLVAICDESQERLDAFAVEMNIDAPRFTDITAMLNSVAEIDAVVITVPDFNHAAVAEACLNHGKAVLLEKPMAQNLDHCRKIIAAQRKNNKTVQMGLVLRHNPTLKKLKELLKCGIAGKILTINAVESINTMHGASYMRRWHRKKANSGSFILAKCSHDLDALAFLTGETPCKVASFGDISFFKPEKMQSSHCSECSDQTCRFRFKGEYVRMSDREKNNPAKFDLCVYTPDKDIVDHQVVILEYPGGIKATFTLKLFSPHPNRLYEICGSDGYLYADLENGTIQFSSSTGAADQTWSIPRENNSSHGGCDLTLFNEFIQCVTLDQKPTADFLIGVAANVTGDAIERARETNTVVTIKPEEYCL